MKDQRVNGAPSHATRQGRRALFRGAVVRRKVPALPSGQQNREEGAPAAGRRKILTLQRGA